jgi:hypothetical protein
MMSVQDLGTHSFDTDFEIIFQNDIYDLTPFLDSEQKATDSYFQADSMETYSSSSNDNKSEVSDENLTANNFVANLNFDMENCANNDLNFLDDFIELLDNSMHSIQNPNEFVLNINEKSSDGYSVETRDRSAGDACLDLENDECDSSEDIVSFLFRDH